MIDRNLESFPIRDFSPGIRRIPSPFQPPGVADEATNRCLSTSEGVLIPTPKLTQTITASNTLANLKGSATLVSSEYRISGIFANDPVYSTLAANKTVPGPDQNNSELWVGIEWWDTAANNYHRAVCRYHRHRTTPSWEQIWAKHEAGVYDANSRPKRAVFGNSRSNRTNPSQVGPVVVACVFAGEAFYSPDDATPLTTSTRDMPKDTANYPPNYLVMHQNRAVIFPLVSLGANANTVHPDNEAFYWTNVNDLSTRDSALSSYANTVAYVEQSHGYEYARSLSSDQLFLMKRSGGALILQGDLNYFRAIPRPGVISPGLAFNEGAVTPIGFVYPIDRGGVAVWEGGDSSQEIANYMGPDFWRPAQLNPANGSQVTNGWGTSETSCACWRDLVLFPSNWVLDTRTMSWWRLYPTAQRLWTDTSSNQIPGSMDFHWWTVDWTGRWAWGAPSGFSTDANSPVLHEFDFTKESDTYVWKSAPLAFSLSEQVEVQDVVLWAKGNTSAATVDITVSSDHDAGFTQTYNCSTNGRAIRSSRKYGVKGTGIQITIEAKSNDPDVGAPRIYGIDVLFVRDTYARRF